MLFIGTQILLFENQRTTLQILFFEIILSMSNLNFSIMKSKYALLMIVILMIIGSKTSIAKDKNWIAPEYSNSLVNPFKGNESATSEGKTIFIQMCVMCSRIKAEGNSEAGLSLERKPANFLALKVLNETDDAIFWKSNEGKAPMASYIELLREDQLWKLVNYIQKLELK
jgi:hypothetical protein